MEDKSIFELIAEYSAGTISPADAELLRERLESDAEAMRLFREVVFVYIFDDAYGTTVKDIHESLK